MISRIGILGCTFFILLFLFYISPWLQQSVCLLRPLHVVSRFCPSAEESSWNLFYHLGGNGPWIPRAAEGTDNLPMKCEVDQVHMISRHAERYPTRNAGARHLALLNKLKGPNAKLRGSLEFLNEWQYFTNFSEPSFEDLTDSGPYAGTRQAFESGDKLRKKYGQLLKPNATTNFWTCGAPRDIETAKHFANGFFGTSWQDDSLAKLQIIPETAERGGNTLTPGNTCLKYIDDKVNGHDRGYAELAVWQDTFTPPIAARLQGEAGGMSFDAVEIYSMMEMCGFEILARGSSSWCAVFTREEWLDFEYGRDLLHFYRAGPGNEFAGVMGWLWLNATTTLLKNNEAAGVYLSFVHDGDIVPLLTTLGILDESRDAGFLSNNKRKPNRKWKTSDVVPMSGRLIFERVTCTNTGLGQNLRRSYVRLFINDGIVNLEKSMFAGGLPNSVGMIQWADIVRKTGAKLKSFNDVCELPSDAPSSITFLQPQYR